MRLVKLTDSLTEERFYVDFDKVTDVIECGCGTILRCGERCGEQSVTVKESIGQIYELVKQAKEI